MLRRASTRNSRPYSQRSTSCRSRHRQTSRTAALRARLERVGETIGGNDLLIAAQALSLGHAVVTDNDREFGRIDDLRCENWLREST